MYTCGPTVYDYAHIGNFRAYVCADLLKRYLKFRGYSVVHIMNITDVDDKTIKGAQEKKIPLAQYTAEYTQAFFDDLGALNIEPANVFPKATDCIPEMIALIETLKQRGHTYERDGSVYFRIASFPSYGKLSRIRIEEMKENARVDNDEYDKESAKDFVLWKGRKGKEPFWDSPFGPGRPGWHIECSAMAMKYLGPHIDIHAGGIDLIFPHHENEIAQSEAATGEPFVSTWMHNEYLFVEGKKMSKSLGNFYTLRDVLRDGHKPMAIRYLLLSAHYRTPLNFTEEGLKAAQAARDRLIDLFDRLQRGPFAKQNYSKIPTLLEHARKHFIEALDDDLNVSDALAVVFDLVKELNKLLANEQVSTADAELCREFFADIDRVLGLQLSERSDTPLDAEVEALINKREQARLRKDFKTADRIRDELKRRGILLEDEKKGIHWKKS